MRCWYTRWQLSSALDRGELSSRMARGHAARCASCQAFGGDLAALHARLSRDSHTAAPPRPVVGRTRTRWLVAGPLAAGAAGAAAVIAIALGMSPRPDPLGSLPARASVETSEVLARIQGLADGVSQLFARTPLESELDNLVDDGKRGLDAVLATGGL
jgi:hypothetical protein